MKFFTVALALAILQTNQGAEPKSPPPAKQVQEPDNPAIDMPGYLRAAAEAAKHRATRRLSEEKFIDMSLEPGTLVLDARSKDMYDLLHVAGALNLPFSDIAIDSLAKVLPDKTTRILIYCNNNFRNEPVAFAPKAKQASLNLSTYISLYSYGYRNIYELAPILDPKASKLVFVAAPKK